MYSLFRQMTLLALQYNNKYWYNYALLQIIYTYLILSIVNIYVFFIILVFECFMLY